jgi:hypothetical protein
MVELESRHFENRLVDYSVRSEELVTRSGALSARFREEVRKLAETLLAEWRDKLRRDPSSGVSGESVYTGLGGPALLYYSLFCKTNVSSWRFSFLLCNGWHFLL